MSNERRTQDAKTAPDGFSMANIALVDDDKNILASVSMLLEQEGYHVRTFSDGAAASPH